MNSNLLALVVIFVPLSLMAIGGTNTIIPEMHLQIVNTKHWMSNREFADIFAIAQSAPGPSTLIVTLIGYEVAGLLGAAVATIATITLPSILTYILTQLWERDRDSKLHFAVEHGLAPITVGLVFASGLIVCRAADHGVAAYVATAIATLLFVRTKINPLLIVAIFGVLGILGLL